MSCQSLQGGSLLTVVVVLFVAGITLQTGAEQTDRHADRQARQTVQHAALHCMHCRKRQSSFSHTQMI